MAEYEPDRLFVPERVIEQIIRTNGTPFYIYDEAGIQQSIQRIRNAFSGAGCFQNFFALRENTNASLLRILAQRGTGVSVCSDVEMQFALRCGFAPGQILYEPSRTDCIAEKRAKDMGLVWLVNSPALLPEKIPEYVLLRYHPADLWSGSNHLHSVKKSKNGFLRQQLIDTVRRACKEGSRHIGLALQISNYSLQSGFWERKMQILLDLAEEIFLKTGCTIWALHIGEGISLPYIPETVVPGLEAEAEKAVRQLGRIPEVRRPAVFTGINKFLLEPHGLLVMKVLEERTLLHQFLVMDCGIDQYLRSVLRQAYRHISVLGKREKEGRRLYHLVGELPNEGDRISGRGHMLPFVKAGDFCVMHDVGCGGRSAALLYGFHAIPPEYLYQKNGTVLEICSGRSEREVAEFITAW